MQLCINFKEDLENHIDEKHEDIFQVQEDRVTQVQALPVDKAFFNFTGEFALHMFLPHV